MKNMSAIRVNVDKDLHRAARVQAVQDDVTLAVIVTAALKDYLAKRQRLLSRGKVR